ncbi:hypothetical protein GGI12_006143, partial [Dipsacomyces acuminosporus]
MPKSARPMTSKLQRGFSSSDFETPPNAVDTGNEGSDGDLEDIDAILGIPPPPQPSKNVANPGPVKGKEPVDIDSLLSSDDLLLPNNPIDKLQASGSGSLISGQRSNAPLRTPDRPVLNQRRPLRTTPLAGESPAQQDPDVHKSPASISRPQQQQQPLSSSSANTSKRRKSNGLVPKKPPSHRSLVDAMESLVKSGKAKRAFGWTLAQDDQLIEEARKRKVNLELNPVFDTKDPEAVPAPKSPGAIFGDVGQPGSYD